MGRLKHIAPRLGSLPPRIARGTDAEGHGKADDWRGWYNLSEWKHPEHGLRIRTFKRDGFRCQWPGCGRLQGDLSQLVADHIEPHRGDRRRFFDPDNLQTLCKSPCHDKHKQAQERRDRRF